jgi:hypothetical protein
MSAVARSLVAVTLLALVSGCTTALPAWVPFTRASEETVRGNMDARGRESQPAPDQPSDEALYQLGVSQADPTSSLRDYRAARATFTRLLIEFPGSRRTVEARAWQATLTDLLVGEDDARRSAQRLQRLVEEHKRTKADFDWLKQNDLDQERRR